MFKYIISELSLLYYLYLFNFFAITKITKEFSFLILCLKTHFLLHFVSNRAQSTY